MQLFIVILCLSLLVGLLGSNTRFGFWGNFFASMALTPLVGILLVFAATSKPSKTE